jgi:membrane peptidoglycan carboxypeptidase
MYIRDYLEEKYGLDEVLNGGLKVTTTLDYDSTKTI